MKKTRKMLALLLSFLFVTGLLSGCGGDPAGTSPASDPPSASGAPAAPLDIAVNATFYETENAGVVLKKFADTVSELSNGAMECTISWGGTLYDTAGQLDAVREGAVDMVVLVTQAASAFLPYLSFPGTPPAANATEGVAYYNEILLHDPVTSELIGAEAAALGIKYLGTVSGGENAFAADFAWSTLDELVAGCGSFGAMATAKYEALGLTCAAYGGNDVYDAISRGIIDAANFGLYGIYGMSWAEVAPYIVRDTLWASNSPYTVNLDWWNGLTAEQQDILLEAMEITTAYSCEIFDNSMDEIADSIEEISGVPVLTLNDEDSQRWWACTFEATAENAISTVENDPDKLAGMITILEKAAELTDYDWSYGG